MGNGILFLQPRQKLFSWFVKCERQTGHETLEISVPTLPPGVIISDPQNLDFVFKNEGLFNKGRFVKERSWDLFGKSYDVPLENRRGNFLCEDLSLSLTRSSSEDRIPHPLHYLDELVRSFFGMSFL